MQTKESKRSSIFSRPREEILENSQSKLHHLQNLDNLAGKVIETSEETIGHNMDGSQGLAWLELPTRSGCTSQGIWMSRR